MTISNEYAKNPPSDKLRSLFENLVTIEELATITGFSKKTIYKWVHLESIPVRRIRGRLFFEKSKVREWLERS